MNCNLGIENYKVYTALKIWYKRVCYYYKGISSYIFAKYQTDFWEYQNKITIAIGGYFWVSWFFKISMHFLLGCGKKKMSIIFCAQSRILISIPPWNLYLEKALQTNTHFQPNSNSIVCSLLSQNRNFLIMFIIKGCSITKSFFFYFGSISKTICG